MKLLNKSFKRFLWFMLAIMLLSIPLFYFTIQYIYIKDADDSLYVVKEKLQDRINKLIEDQRTAKEIVELLNQLEIGYFLEEITDDSRLIEDRIYTTSRFDAYHGHVEPFRVLESVIWIDEIPYFLKAEIDMEEYYDVLPYTALLAGLFFLLIVVGYYLVNRKIEKKVWSPFLTTLSELENHNIGSDMDFKPIESDIEEFQTLSRILRSFIGKNSLLFRQQKEFIENASHELQTPIALLHSKTDLLFQTKELSEEQSYLLDEVKQIGSRMNKINSGLLLLAKIENRQFVKNETFPLKPIVESSMIYFEEWASAKNIKMVLEVEDEMEVLGNKILAEIAINNLIKNAIRYNSDPGHISIQLKSNSLAIRNSSKIPELDGSKVFQRFFKSHADQNGSGLGLAIVKEISDFNDWKINYSYLDEKHTFTLGF